MPSYLLSCPDDAPRSTFSDGRGGPVAGLCNQLVVTSVVCSLSFRVLGSHPSTGATGSLLRDTPGVTLHNELSTTVRDSRCRRPSPRMARRLVPPRQLWPCLFPLRSRGRPGSGRLPHRPCQPLASRRDAAADAPCRDVAQAPANRHPHTAARALSARIHQRPRLPTLGTPSIDRACRAPPRSRRRTVPRPDGDDPSAWPPRSFTRHGFALKR